MNASKKIKLDKMAQTLKPLRMWIDGKCYNITKNKQKGITLEQSVSNEADDQHDFNITLLDSGKLSSSFRLPSWYYIKLNELDKNLINKLAVETNTEIKYPKYGQDGNIDISGNDEKNIVSAREKIQATVSEIRQKATPLQFISIPVLSDEIKSNFIKFRDEILEGEPIEGLDPSIFQSELKLHLTVNVFSLMDETEKQEAVSALNDYKTSILEPLVKNVGPLKIKVAGIDCMNENYSKVHVLYANACLTNENEELSLQNIANAIADYFYERGLLKKYEDIRLHVTLINTKYRKTAEDTPKKSRWHGKRTAFDARKIMEKYKDFVFGEVDLDQVHLSLMSSKGEDGFYKPLSIIKV